MQSSELIGAMLDYWTARAEGLDAEVLYGQTIQHATEHQGVIRFEEYAPSTNWAHAGPLIEKHHLNVSETDPPGWVAWADDTNMEYGPTPLVAICRAVVRAKFGDEVPA